MKEEQGALVVDKALCVTNSWIEAWIFWREYVDLSKNGRQEERETESEAAENPQLGILRGERGCVRP